MLTTTVHDSENCFAIVHFGKTVFVFVHGEKKLTFLNSLQTFSSGNALLMHIISTKKNNTYLLFTGCHVIELLMKKKVKIFKSNTDNGETNSYVDFSDEPLEALEDDVSNSITKKDAGYAFAIPF